MLHFFILYFCAALERVQSASGDLLLVVYSIYCRGSLYRLLRKTDAKEILDERRRLNMAFDVVYLSINNIS